MALIDEWRSAWKWLSIQANSVGIAISGTYAMLYDQLKENFPPKIMAAVTGGVFIAGIIGRLVSQDKKE